MKFDPKKDTVRLIVIVLSAAITAVNIKTFVRVGNLFPGGVSGISILIQRCAERFYGMSIPYSPIYYLLNLVPIYIGFRYIGKKFTLFSVLDILLVGLFTDIFPSFPLTYDPLLISVFGGIIGGVAAAMVLGANASGGGLDFVTMYLSEKRGVDSFGITLGLNVIILIIAGLLFGWEESLYSIIYQFVNTQVIRTLFKKFQQDTLIIVTDWPEEVCMAINEVSNHSATIFEGKGAYEGKTKYMVYSVVAASESGKLKKDVRIVDPQAFVNVINTREIGGRFYRAKAE